MNREQIFKIIESKIKLQGDTQLNFYYNKVKEHVKELERENKELKQELKDKR